jgi:hypothetical protein
MKVFIPVCIYLCFFGKKLIEWHIIKNVRAARIFYHIWQRGRQFIWTSEYLFFFEFPCYVNYGRLTHKFSRKFQIM